MFETVTEAELEKDREAILDVHHRYIVANTTVDWDELGELWDHDPRNVYYNLTGHFYRGFGHWKKLWQYYKPRVKYDLPWKAFDQNVTINGRTAWVTCLRMHRLAWTSEDDNPMGAPDAHITRSTEVLVKGDDDRWRVVHAHFSYAAMTPRPGNV